METNEIYAVRLEKKGVKPTAVRILVCLVAHRA